MSDSPSPESIQHNTLVADAGSNAYTPRIVLPDDSLREPDLSMPLGRRLVDAGLIREDQLETALAHQESEEERLRALAEQAGTATVGRTRLQRFKRLGEVVSELGLVDETALLPLLGEQLGVEGVRLREGLIDPNAVRLVPREYAERFKILPLMRVRDELTVAMADPQDLSTIDAIARLSGCRIRPIFTLAAGIERLLPRCYEDDFTVDSVTADLDVEQLELESEAIDLDLHGTQQLAERQPGDQLGELRHHSSRSSGR